MSMWRARDTRSTDEFVAGLGTRFAVKDVGEASYDSTRSTTSSATGRTRSVDWTGHLYMPGPLIYMQMVLNLTKYSKHAAGANHWSDALSNKDKPRTLTEEAEMRAFPPTEKSSGRGYRQPLRTTRPNICRTYRVRVVAKRPGINHAW